MFDWIAGMAVGFWVGYLLTWPSLIALIVFGICFEHYEARGWAVFMALVAAVVSFTFFSVPLTSIAIYAVLYVGIGLVWSFYRYKRYVTYKVDHAIECHYSSSQKEILKHSLHPTQQLGTITAWIIVWPFSVVDNFIGDIIDGIQTLVRKVFHGVYVRIYETAIAALGGNDRQ